jgi:hypothetical protein
MNRARGTLMRQGSVRVSPYRARVCHSVVAGRRTPMVCRRLGTYLTGLRRHF